MFVFEHVQVGMGAQEHLPAAPLLELELSETELPDVVLGTTLGSSAEISFHLLFPFLTQCACSCTLVWTPAYLWKTENNV